MITVQGTETILYREADGTQRQLNLQGTAPENPHLFVGVHVETGNMQLVTPSRIDEVISEENSNG